MHRSVPIGTMRNEIKHTKDTRDLLRPTSQITTLCTERSPNDVGNRVHSNWTIQQIKNDRGASKRHVIVVIVVIVIVVVVVVVVRTKL